MIQKLIVLIQFGIIMIRIDNINVIVCDLWKEPQSSQSQSITVAVTKTPVIMIVMEMVVKMNYLYHYGNNIMIRMDNIILIMLFD